jgi:adenosylcobinamide-phosphate synthase
MFGYKNERYFYFGRAAARLDDVANYLPARLRAALVTLSAFVLRMPWKESVQVVVRYASLQPSPNAGFPEAAYAGALRVRLGGTNFYDGCLVHKPYIGIRSGGLQSQSSPNCDVCFTSPQYCRLEFG